MKGGFAINYIPKGHTQKSTKAFLRKLPKGLSLQGVFKALNSAPLPMKAATKVARKLPIAKVAKKLPVFSGGNFSSKISPMKAGGFMAKFTPIASKTSGFSKTTGILKRATKLGTVAKKKVKKKSGITKIN